MRPFVLLATRPEDEVADAEYASFLKFGRLEKHELKCIRLDQGQLPPPDFDDISGFIIAGSPFSASTPPKKKTSTQISCENIIAKLLDKAVPADFPLFGACYGIGTLAAHQGAVIDETYGEEVSAPWLELTPDGQEDPLLAGFPRRFQGFVGHKESCTVLPPNAQLLLSSKSCPVQMLRIGKNMYATQFHPELDYPALAQRARAYSGYGYYDPAKQEEILTALARADVNCANAIVGRFTDRYAR